MNYGLLMKEIRTLNKFSQEEIANKLNIKRSTYKEFELQNSIIPLKHLNNFCNIFNISLDYILGLNNKQNYKNIKQEVNSDTVIKRLKEFRKNNNLTQEKLAAIMKVGKGTIGDYEVGSRLISTPFLYELCQKYNISADYLLGKIDEPKYLK